MQRKPDMLEYVIRFVCGAVLGGLLGVVLVKPHDLKSTLLGPIFFALSCGLLAMLRGDSFWETFGHWFGFRR